MGLTDWYGTIQRNVAIGAVRYGVEFWPSSRGFSLSCSLNHKHIMSQQR